MNELRPHCAGYVEMGTFDQGSSKNVMIVVMNSEWRKGVDLRMLFEVDQCTSGIA